MLTNLVYVFVGGGIGSLVRYGITLLMYSYYRTIFPLATMFSNLLSCVVLGVTVWVLGEKFNTDLSLRMLIITGFCGGFSTFSSFSYETVLLVKEGYMSYAILNVVVSVILCFGILYLLTRSVIS